MAIDFDKEKFLKNISEVKEKTLQEVDFEEEEIIMKELKKRYNISIKPSINRKLVVESRRRNISKSELIEILVEKNL